MPSEKRRINLTVPDELYQRIQEYKKIAYVTSDATACMQLISKQLESMNRTEELLDVLKRMSTDDVHNLVAEGMQEVKNKTEGE